jgi:hypothetical protein
LASRIALFFAALLSVTFAAPVGASEQEGLSALPPPLILERLIYEVRWDPPWYFFFLPTMEAGEIEIFLEEKAEKNALDEVKIVFKAHSSGTLARISGIEVEDTFVFFAEPETLCSQKTSKKIREGKRKRQIDVVYLRDKRQLHIRELDESITPAEVKKDQIKNDIPSCVHDPLSAIYLLRRSALHLKQVQTFIIGYDDRISKIESRVEKEETIKTPVGKFPAWQISTTPLIGGLFKGGGRLRLWFSADERKIPIQFEANVKLGKVLGKLKTYESLSYEDQPQ